jgi:gas vesicle protein
MTTRKALLGVLAGIAAGTVIGIMLAPPKSGRLRKIISRKSEVLADTINDKIDEKFEELLKNVFWQSKENESTGRSQFRQSGSLKSHYAEVLHPKTNYAYELPVWLYCNADVV